MSSGIQWGVKTVYNKTVRPFLPRKIVVRNGIPTRTAKLFDSTDFDPEWENTLVQAVREHVRETDDVLIVGGGFGVSAVTAIRRTDGDATVLEAAEEMVDTITETLVLSSVDTGRVDLKHAVVGRELNVWGSSKGATSIEPADLPDCDILIMDCEGAERDILSNVRIRPREIIVESHGDLGSPTTAVKESLERLGYEVEIIGPDVEEKDYFILRGWR